MSNKLADIRKKLQEENNRAAGNFSGGDDALFKHWDLEDGAQTTIRFVPDGDESNSFFWVDKQVIKLPFPGIVGGDQKEVVVSVPCAEMWGDTCPVLTEVRPWFKDPSLEDLARTYWKKHTYMMQGFVQVNGVISDTQPENPIRRFNISPSIFGIIKAALLDPDMEYSPDDYVNGTDFTIIKTKKGKWADYTTSKWARKETALTEDQLEAIETHGLSNLTDFLPKRPDAESLVVIAEMFEASVNGEQYDPTRWAKFYKPFGLDTPATVDVPFGTQAAEDTDGAATADTTQAVVNSSVVATEDADSPAANAATDDGGQKSANEILEMLRKRS